jgi:hypothetical protein
MVRKNFKPSWPALGLAALLLISGFSVADHAAAALTTFETADFSGSGICAVCHSRLSDEEPKDVSMDAHWRSTMMANAAKDPLWQAKISAEVALVPHNPEIDLKQVIQEKCSRCHMGMARYQQLADGDTKKDIYVFDTDPGITGFLNPAHYLHEAAMDGVSCTLCHQIRPDNLGTPDSFTGQYEIDTSTQSPDRVLFGPYINPLRNPMQQSAGFLPTHHAPGMQLADSAHCGSCHTLYTPALDAYGNILKEFPEQTTYLEWEHSQFNPDKTCQDCHLPDAVGEVVISNRPRWLTARSPFGQHHYVGGNTFMVNLLETYAGDLGVTAEPTHLQATHLWTLTQLEAETANVTATASLTGTGERLKVTVTVENLAGHKFPSGLPSRRAWLHVTVADAGGTIVFESGKPLTDGRIEGNAADMDPADFEPHYDKIRSSDEVQIYEPVMKNFEGNVTYTLLRAYEYAKDNRLLPAGFDKDTAVMDIGVYGRAATDIDFIGGSDRIVYDVDVTGAQMGLTVTVDLLFQVLSYPFIEDLRAVETPETPLVGLFMGMYDPADKTPVVVDTIEFTVP